MSLRYHFLTLAALTFGCGTAQLAMGPEQETLTGDFPPHLSQDIAL